MVDLYYKYKNKTKFKKTVSIKITKTDNFIKDIQELRKLIESWEIII